MDVERCPLPSRRVIPGVYEMSHRSGTSTYTISVLGHFNESSIQVWGLGPFGSLQHTGLCEGGQLRNGCHIAKFPSSQHTRLHSLKIPAFPHVGK